MPKLSISRSININAPKEKIIGVVSDFHQWQPWSPWLIMEEGVKVTVDPEKKYYKWEGNRVGSGEMQITNETDARVDYDLTFLTPFKSHAKIAFEVQDTGEVSKVTWHMDSSLPFFMFWMKKMMTAFLESDYDRGLLMLKEYIEEGKVSSKLEMKGENEFSGVKYIGITTSTGTETLDTAMEKDITRLSDWFREKNIETAGNPFSIYHKWDMVKKQATYTSAFPVREIPSSVDDGFVTGEIPAQKVFTVRHIGPYRYLGNLWGFGENLKRSKVFKINKKTHPFETYVNTPDEVSENDLITEVHFGVK